MVLGADDDENPSNILNHKNNIRVSQEKWMGIWGGGKKR